jgi:hypothetical protein
MQRPSAVRASTVLKFFGEIDINAVKEMKKTDFLKKFW